ncbi:MAG: restriction endonuclease subunit S [Anaerolineales bacterium]|nr:restriction endonuclease subunit S [Anaerolineales bacterium]
MAIVWQSLPFSEILKPISRPERVDRSKIYRILGMRWYAQGLFIKEDKPGHEIQATELYRVERGDFVYNRLFAWKGSFGIVNNDTAGGYVSGEFPCFRIHTEKAEPKYIHLFLSQEPVWKEIERNSSGQTNISRLRLKVPVFLEMKIPLPPLDEQRRIVGRIETLAGRVEKARRLRREAVEETHVFIQATLGEVFGKTANWNIYTLNEVAPINMGQSPPGDSYNFDGAGVPLLNGPTEFGQKYPKPRQWTTSPTKFCNSGDILICVRGATTGKMNWADRKYCIGRGLAALTVDTNKCLPEFVYHYVQTRTQEILARTAGSTFPNLPGEKLRTLPIPVPPLDEQQYLVAYLASLLSLIVLDWLSRNLCEMRYQVG